MRLLEEPQWCLLLLAAVIRGGLSHCGEGLTVHVVVPRSIVLIVDVGGGTSDFSLFEVGPGVLIGLDIRRGRSANISCWAAILSIWLLGVLLESSARGGTWPDVLARSMDRPVASCRDLKE